jgi:hypothetical protein
MAGVSQIVYPLHELTFAPDATGANSVAVLPPNIGSQSIEWTFYIAFATSTSAGVVKVESSYSRDYTGTWPAEATVTFTGTAPNMQVVHLTALNEALRLRISTTIADSTGVRAFAMAANKT